MKKIKQALITLQLVFLCSLLGCSTGSFRPNPVSLPPLTNPLYVVDWSTRVGVGSFGRPITLTPAIFQEYVYVANANGQVTAVNLSNGKILWTKSYGVPISSDLGVSSQYLMFGTSDAKLLLVDRLNGKLLWRRSVSNEVLSKPIYHQGKIVVQPIDSVVKAFDAHSGNVSWVHREEVPEVAVQSNHFPLLAPNGEHLVVGFPNGKLVALSAKTGQPIWHETLSDYVGTPSLEKMVDVNVQPKVFAGQLYATGYYGKLSVFNLNTRQLQWNHSYGASALSMEVDEFSVYILDNQSRLWCLNRKTGHVSWKKEQMLYRNLTTLVEGNNTLLVGDREGYLLVLSKDKGEIISKMRVDDSGVLSTPLVYQGNVILLTESGTLMSLKLRKS